MLAASGWEMRYTQDSVMEMVYKHSRHHKINKENIKIQLCNVITIDTPYQKKDIIFIVLQQAS